MTETTRTAPAEWFLTHAERDNPWSRLDGRDPGSTAWSEGNLAQPLIDGAEYFPRLVAELADVQAGDQVYLSAWIVDQNKQLDGTGTSMREQFARVLRDGASVHALLWWPYLDLDHDLVAANRELASSLRDMGGSVVLDQRVRPAGCHHQKFLVIRRPGRPERDVAFLGGIDPCPSRLDRHEHHGDGDVQLSIDRRRYGRRPAWHDAHLEVRGPAVADVEHCFRERWQDAAIRLRGPLSRLRRRFGRGEPEAAELPAQLPPPPRSGSHSVQLLRTYPTKHPPYLFARRGERSVARGYAKALQRARQLVYVEDQFLWSPMVAEVFAAALRREPELRLVAVVPAHPEKGGAVEVATCDAAQDKALRLLYAAGGDRVDVFELENDRGLPTYLHSKVCVMDDSWAAVGSANLNRRSWTYDSELTAAVLDERQPTTGFARDLRLRLWREHLGRDRGDDSGLADPRDGVELLRNAAAELDAWHESGRTAPRPRGQLRRHPRRAKSAATRLWAVPLGRLMIDPDGRPLRARLPDRSRDRGSIRTSTSAHAPPSSEPTCEPERSRS
ncbi:phospholipase [Saccharopolyspora terrae]|uniref:Phospholipase n=1 Tax=Saccharopolyspora terrae TaxID=2530384 RepID=A0A4R4VPE8_9PSEU|nr:phospholipase D family protein [Saccharopolyspora terrae]TDD07602.1 phospholipase [Saccharopolyspora terrae]